MKETHFIPDAQQTYELGQRYPYDNKESGDWADKAARGIIADLCDRRSIKSGFQGVDLTVKKEIVSSLAAIIR